MAEDNGSAIAPLDSLLEEVRKQKVQDVNEELASLRTKYPHMSFTPEISARGTVRIAVAVKQGFGRASG